VKSDRDLDELLSELGAQEYCYLTTTGRVSGRPHEIEIWFAAKNHTLYLLSGSGKSDWLKNLNKNPAVTVRIAKHTFPGTARLVTAQEEDTTARYLVAEKYQEWQEGRLLSDWARTALPVAIDITSQHTVP
jgi:deazaflavin-dependent oxidoreductase (nitroreductase family)